MLTFLPVLFILIFSSGAISAALLATGKQARQQSASNDWRLVVLRNGITSESPFSPIDSKINAPGLVQVWPKSQTPTQNLSMSLAPVGAPAQAETAPIQERKPDESQDDAKKVSEKVTKTKETRFKWGYPQGGFEADDITTEALNALNRLIQDGETRKTVLSWAVFGSNGGAVYSTARPTIQKALDHAL